MEKSLIKKCNDIVNAIADEDALKITLSLVTDDKNILQLQEETEIDADTLKEKVVSLVDSKILRFKNDKKTFTLDDAHVLAIAREIKEKAEKEIFNERTI